MKLKVVYQTTAAAVLGCFAAANAMAQESGTIMGDVAVSVGSADYDVDLTGGSDIPKDTNFLAIEGYVGVALSPMFEAGLSFSGRDDEEDSTATGTDEVGGVHQIALHLDYAVSEMVSVGGFVATGEVNLVNGEPDESGENFGISVEVTDDFATFYGKLGRQNLSADDSEAMEDATWAQVGMVKDFFGGDIGASLVFGGGDNRQNEDIDFAGFTLAYGRPIGDSGASWFTAIDRYKVVNNPENESLVETAIRFGIQFTFGKDTKSVPTHKTVPTLPLLATGWTVDVVD